MLDQTFRGLSLFESIVYRMFLIRDLEVAMRGNDRRECRPIAAPGVDGGARIGFVR
jgi:hypothetical protein